MFICFIAAIVVVCVTFLNFATIVVLTTNLNKGLNNLDQLQNDTITFYTNVATERIAKSLQDTGEEILRISKIGYYSYYYWMTKYKAAAAASPTHEYNKLKTGSTTDLYYDISWECEDITQANLFTLDNFLIKSPTTSLSKESPLSETGFFWQVNGVTSRQDRLSLHGDFRIPLKMATIAIDEMRSQFDHTYNYTRISVMFWKTDSSVTPNKVTSTGLVYPGGCNTLDDFMDPERVSIHDLSI